MTIEIQTTVIVITNIIVGVILWQQIRSQKSLIKKYKGYVEALSPDKIIALHDKEVEQLKKTYSFDEQQLKTQLLELAIYVDYHLTDLYKTDTDFSIDRQTHINRNVPHCSKLLQSVNDYMKSKTPNA